MCEFKVSVSDGKSSSVVATDIVYAEQVEGRVVLRDILGVSSEVDSAVISYVNVNSQQMKLLSLPILSSFLRFVELYTQCASGRGATDELESVWNRLTEEGNRLIEGLKSK
ncbi:MAG: CooT family nickel-binding protein [Candidatus Freyrarchaeum guaymaensis]|nr:CooT family nickel-binding protein [Candidatus Sigynarchaeota archaeon]